MSLPESSIIPFKTAKRVAKEARQVMEKGRNGEIDYLKTRWDSVNAALAGGFHFGDLTLLAGLSGHGKSYFLTNLQAAFMDEELNPEFAGKVLILHFGFEMLPADEVLRMLTSKMGKSFHELKSAEYPLDDTSFEEAVEYLKVYSQKPIFFADRPGTRQEIIETVYSFKNMFPDKEIVITLDHTLLTEFMDESSEVDLIAKMGKDLVKLNKELKPIIILLGQLNDNIEKPVRREPHLHFPVKGDIFGSKQIYHAMDQVLVLHSPEMLNLDTYGVEEYPTDDLIALHFLKMRNGFPGLVRLRKDLSKGLFEEWAQAYQM